MGLKAAMMKDAKKDKKGWSFGFLGSKNKAYKDAQEALDEIDNPGNTSNAVASNDYEEKE